MATVNGSIKLDVRLTQTAPTGYTGGEVATVAIDTQISSGTGLNQGDLLYSGATSITGSGSVDIDLRALTSPQGAALSGLAEIATIIIEWPSTAAAALTVTPSASNGLAALGLGFVLQPGAKVMIFCPQAAAYAVDGTHKSLNFANAGATASATITLLGRSA